MGEAETFGAAALRDSGFDAVDDLAIRDAEGLNRIASLARPARILAAVRIGKTRLIDNMAV
jgi:pantoate--beta-alanine ligase